MPETMDFRDLLFADVVREMEAVDAALLARALKSTWTRRGRDGSSLVTEILRLSDLAPDALDAAEREADRLVADAAGDDRLALVRRGGLDVDIVKGILGSPSDLPPIPMRTGADAHASLRKVSTDRYVDFEVAGEGGMGVVYMALDTELNRFVALKVARSLALTDATSGVPTTPFGAQRPADDSSDAAAVDELEMRFLQEAWVTGGLEHPGVVPVYELGATPGGVPYYTMRFIRGQRTLGEAIDEVHDGPLESRLKLLEPFLKVCDTVRYAHSRGVVHRDLKPENVAIGEFGEVVILDWGLARLDEQDGQDGQAATVWQERVGALRESGDLHTRVGAIGTPGYMSAEAATGRLDEIDARSDIFSLGVILYEILTGTLPYATDSYETYVEAVSRGEAPPARSRRGDVPDRLSALCTRCLSRERDHRPAAVEEVAETIRAWQTASAAEREAEGHLRDARSALSAADGSQGTARLEHVDRGAAALKLASSKLPEHVDLPGLQAQATRLRDAGIRECGRVNTRRLYVRVGVTALVLVAIGALVVAGLLDEARRRAERERSAKAAALEANQRHLTEILRLSDVKRIRDLEDVVEDLAPAQPDIEARTTAWLAQARELAQTRPEHEAALAALRARSLSPGPPWRFPTVEAAWQHEVLEDLIGRLELLQTGEKGAPRRVRRLHDLAVQLRETDAANAAAWREMVEAVAGHTRHAGLRLARHRGLVPLGRDPTSGLFEFAQVGSGRVPERDPETGRLKLAEDAAIVFVLLPGGTFRMGALDESPDPPDAHPSAGIVDIPVHRVVLPPLFLAKHECTQAQWHALTLGSDPPGSGSGRLPAGNVSWELASRTLGRHGLRLPTEAEWEYACRAGTETHFWSGSTEDDLSRVGWYVGNSGERPHEVGEKPANAFGLHDVHGNMLELCLDDWHPSYRGAPEDGSAWIGGGPGSRVHRSGSYILPPGFSRSANRSWVAPLYSYRDIGFRAARSAVAE